MSDDFGRLYHDTAEPPPEIHQWYQDYEHGLTQKMHDLLAVKPHPSPETLEALLAAQKREMDANPRYAGTLVTALEEMGKAGSTL